MIKISSVINSQTRKMVKQALSTKLSKKNPVAIIKDEVSGKTYIRHNNERTVYKTNVDVRTNSKGELIFDRTESTDKNKLVVFEEFKRNLFGFGKIKRKSQGVVDLKANTAGHVDSKGNVEISDYYSDGYKNDELKWNIGEKLQQIMAKLFNSFTKKGENYIEKVGNETRVYSEEQVKDKLRKATNGLLGNDCNFSEIC